MSFILTMVRGRMFVWWCLFAILLIGAILRIASLGWNQYIHGDVSLYSETAESLGIRGNFKIPHDSTQPFFYSVKELGGRMYEFYPLWPMIGAVGVWLFHVSGFAALKLASFFFGVLLIVLTFFVGRQISGNRVGLVSAALVSFSYLLIDFSANGAFYVLQGVLYLLFVLVLVRFEGAKRAVWAGFIMGGAVLLNFQSLALVPGFILFLLYEYAGDGKRFFIFSGIGVGIALLVFAPWAVRNYLVFKNPFFTLNQTYVWQKLGVEKEIKNNVITFLVIPRTYAELVKRVFSVWLPHNLFYINRKLFIEAPLVYIFAVFMAIEVVFLRSREFLRRTLPLFLVLLFHVLISAAWPIPQFRFLVPVLPLFFLMGVLYLEQMRPAYRNAGFAGSIILVMLFSFWIYRLIPSHTYYYDGAITTDIFGGKGEIQFLQSLGNSSNALPF